MIFVISLQSQLYLASSLQLLLSEHYPGYLQYFWRLIVMALVSTQYFWAGRVPVLEAVRSISTVVIVDKYL